MPFTVDHLNSDDLHTTFTFEWGGETGSITYRLGRIHAWMEQPFSTALPRYEQNAQLIEGIVVAWDVETADGTPVPPTYEALMATPLNDKFVQAVIDAIIRDVAPGKVTRMR